MDPVSLLSPSPTLTPPNHSLKSKTKQTKTCIEKTSGSGQARSKPFPDNLVEFCDHPFDWLILVVLD